MQQLIKVSFTKKWIADTFTARECLYHSVQERLPSQVVPKTMKAKVHLVLHMQTLEVEILVHKNGVRTLNFHSDSFNILCLFVCRCILRPLMFLHRVNYTQLFFLPLAPLTRELAPILEHRADYSVSWSFTGGRTPWSGDQLVARLLPKHRTTQTQKNADTY
jgi:hypothetical protein